MATPERIEELKANLVSLQEEFVASECNPTLRDSLIATYSDEYKYENGIRPRWIDWDEYTTLEILIKLDDLYHAEEIAAERERQDREREAEILEKGVGEDVEPEWKTQLRGAFA